MPFGFTFVETDNLADVRARLVRIERAMTLLTRAQQLNTELIMSKISEFSDKANVFFDRQAAAIDEVKAHVDATAADVVWLKAQIDALQNSPGELTPEDQALLDAVEARLSGTATSAEAAAVKAAELDAMTPPAATP